MPSPSENIGIVCPDCKGNLNAYRKVREGTTIEHYYKCLNADCPARESNKQARIITVETFVRVYYLPVNATRRKKRKNLPAANQQALPLADVEPKIESGMERS